MKNLAIFVAALAVTLVSCNQMENDYALTEAADFVEFKADGNTFFNLGVLEDAFTTTIEDLTEEDIAGLILMREEEKMARDVYYKMDELWGGNVFANIAKSEASHMDAVLSLLDHFGIQDPATTEVGVFNSSAIQALYDELTAAGSESALKAFETGAFIEEYDILDLEELLENTTNTDLKLVYGNLLKGSRNHLRAFVRQINVYGESYTPFLLSEEYYTEVLDSEMENVNGNSQWGNRNAGNGNKGNASYSDCVMDGTGGLGSNGAGEGLADCDTSGEPLADGTGNPNDGQGGNSGGNGNNGNGNGKK